MTKSIATIPQVFAGILIAFLTLLTLRVTYPITNYILSLEFSNPILKASAVLGYWLIVIFVCWFLIWIKIFQPIEQKQGT